MAATLGAPSFDSRTASPRHRARAIRGRLRWAVVLMVLLNALVWGGMIAALRGMVDLHQVVDQVWAWSAAWIAAIPLP